LGPSASLLGVAAFRCRARWSPGPSHATLVDATPGVGAEWAVAIDSTVVRAHQHAAGAHHEPPKDVPAEKIAPLRPAPAAAELPGRRGGWIE
jgi:hypothetical protein